MVIRLDDIHGLVRGEAFRHLLAAGVPATGEDLIAAPGATNRTAARRPAETPRLGSSDSASGSLGLSGMGRRDALRRRTPPEHRDGLRDERTRFRDAIIALHTNFGYPGKRSDCPVGGVNYWFKQDEIHQAMHVHNRIDFLPWHRELCNRFEALLRKVDPEESAERGRSG
jgi:hypothetical protein